MTDENKPALLSLKANWIRRGNQKIIGPISFQLAHNETVAITGPSGVGKTSLLRVLAGLDSDFDGNRLAPDSISMVFQEPALLPWRNILENLLLTTRLTATQAQQKLDEINMLTYENCFPGELSLGQQRRVALIRALAPDSPLLLMDEPLASLDQNTENNMISIMQKQCSQRKQARIIVTHEISQAKQLASRILKLNGSPAKLSDITSNTTL